jgi:hypothetical protein
VRSMRYGFRAQPALLVRGSSRRIMTLRFRPAYIRVINRRYLSTAATCSAFPKQNKRAGSSSVEEDPARKNNKFKTCQTRDSNRGLTSRSISEREAKLELNASVTGCAAATESATTHTAATSATTEATSASTEHLAEERRVKSTLGRGLIDVIQNVVGRNRKGDVEPMRGTPNASKTAEAARSAESTAATTTATTAGATATRAAARPTESATAALRLAAGTLSLTPSPGTA